MRKESEFVAFVIITKVIWKRVKREIVKDFPGFCLSRFRGNETCERRETPDGIPTFSSWWIKREQARKWRSKNSEVRGIKKRNLITSSNGISSSCFTDIPYAWCTVKFFCGSYPAFRTIAKREIFSLRCNNRSWWLVQKVSTKNVIVIITRYYTIPNIFPTMHASFFRVKSQFLNLNTFNPRLIPKCVLFLSNINETF